MAVNRGNESDITSFFENLIKDPSGTARDFSSEVNLYLQAFQRNI